MIFDIVGKASSISLVKVVRAYGGCLGIRRRRRTQRAAKMYGELRASIDPYESEWGNPAGEEPVMAY